MGLPSSSYMTQLLRVLLPHREGCLLYSLVTLVITEDLSPRRVAVLLTWSTDAAISRTLGWGPNQVQPPAARRTWRLPGQGCYLLKCDFVQKEPILATLNSSNHSTKCYNLWNVHTFESKLRMSRCKEHTWKLYSLWCGLHLSSLVYICCWNMVILCFCCFFRHSSFYTHGNMNCSYAFAKNVSIFYIQFICTLSAICNTITYLITADEMDQADDELRDTIRNIWPLQAKKMLDLLIPRNEGSLTLCGPVA